MTMKMTASPKASGVGSRSREGISLMSQHLIFQGVGNRQKGGSGNVLLSRKVEQVCNLFGPSSEMMKH